MSNRQEQIEHWLEQNISIKRYSMVPASEDASFRRYFRVLSESPLFGGIDRFIVMDAPPQLESINEFIAIANLLAAINIHAPKIYASDTQQGFVLLEDLGNRTYLDEIDKQTETLYRDAINALIKLQTIGRNADGSFAHQGFDGSFKPPCYDQTLIESELDLFDEWYCDQHKKVQLTKSERSIWTELKQNLIENFYAQPQVWVHRDYHSRNLMVTDDQSPGVIDFQDMVWGPISYDLASLFKDCYIAWPRERQLAWLNDYLTQIIAAQAIPEINIEQLIRWYDLTGLQRHLKVLGIFSRLNYRDNKTHYLADLPLVEHYIYEVLELYPEFDDFRALFDRVSQ